MKKRRSKPGMKLRRISVRCPLTSCRTWYLTCSRRSGITSRGCLRLERMGGVDVIAHTDPLGTQAPRMKVQAKGGSQKIDLQTLNSFLAVVDRDDVGLYVSVGGFTKDAEDAARKQTTRRITLINAERLVERWIE